MSAHSGDVEKACDTEKGPPFLSDDISSSLSYDRKMTKKIPLSLQISFQNGILPFHSRENHLLCLKNAPEPEMF